MQDIAHVNSSYWDWFIAEKYFQYRIDDILMVGRQENFEESFEMLKEKTELREIELPNNDIDIHKNPENLDKYLSTRAIKNLEKWYRGDYKFIELCNKVNKW